MAVIHVIIIKVILCNSGVFGITPKMLPRITGDWWNPCGLHEDYDLCPRYQCVGETCLHFLGLVKCQYRGENMPCRAECRCMKFYYRNKEGKCIPQHDCVPTVCGRNEIFKKCHPCNYADIARVKCPNAEPGCKPGCYCKIGYTRDVFGECVEIRKIEQTEFEPTKLDFNNSPHYNDDMIDKHDEYVSKEIYDMLVTPKSEKHPVNETNLPSLTTRISQTSFKILPIDLQYDFDHRGKSTPLILYSNSSSISTENVTESVTAATLTSYIYKYLSTNNTQNSIIDNELTTITINTIDDENDIKITTTTNNSSNSTSKKPNDDSFYKYVSVSLMNNINNLTKGDMTSNQSIQDIEHDLSDIKVTTTTPYDSLVSTSTKTDFNITSTIDSLKTEVFANFNSINESITTETQKNYTTSDIFNTTNTCSNETNSLNNKSDGYTASYMTLMGNIISKLNSTDSISNVTDYVSLPAVTVADSYNKKLTTFLFSTLQPSKNATNVFKITRKTTVMKTTTDSNNKTDTTTISTVYKSTLTKKQNITSTTTPKPDLKLIDTTSSSSSNTTTKALDKNVTSYTINLMPMIVTQTATLSTVDKKYNHIHLNTSKIPSKGLNYIW